MTPAALLLDLDGTLIDSEPVYIEAYRQILPEFGIQPTEEELQATIGRSDEEALPEMLARRGLQFDPRPFIQRKDACFTALAARGMPVRAGAQLILSHAHHAGITCMVVSSSTRPLVNLCLAASGLASSLPMRICGDEVRHRKPSPVPYLLAASRLGLPASRCLAIEDSISGVRSARTAGCHVVAVSGSFDRKLLLEAGASRVCTSLEELLPLDTAEFESTHRRHNN